MPNRVIREGMLTSERVNSLSWQSECFFYRLMLKADDYGRYDGRESILRASLYPLKISQVREADITRWMAECQKAGLIVLYEADGKRFLEIPKFDQRKRALTSKWPTPDSHVSVICQTPAHEGERRETKARNENTGPPQIPAALCSVKGFVEEWEAFRTHRKKKRAPMSERAEELILSTLSERPKQAIKALQTAIIRNWTGLEWEWLEPKNGAYNKPAKTGRDPDELMSEAAWNAKHGNS